MCSQLVISPGTNVTFACMYTGRVDGCGRIDAPPPRQGMVRQSTQQQPLAEGTGVCLADCWQNWYRPAPQVLALPQQGPYQEIDPKMDRTALLPTMRWRRSRRPNHHYRLDGELCRFFLGGLYCQPQTCHTSPNERWPLFVHLHLAFTAFPHEVIALFCSTSYSCQVFLPGIPVRYSCQDFMSGISAR